MNNNTFQAKAILQEENYTCVLYKNGIVHNSRERGIAPLVSWIDSGENYKGFCAADKVVGKAPAFLYVLMGVEQVYADVMSEAAIEIFAHYEIDSYYNTVVKSIRNRNNTGNCPFEETVKDIDTPEQALETIHRKMAEMAIGKN